MTHNCVMPWQDYNKSAVGETLALMGEEIGSRCSDPT